MLPDLQQSVSRKFPAQEDLDVQVEPAGAYVVITVALVVVVWEVDDIQTPREQLADPDEVKQSLLKRHLQPILLEVLYVQYHEDPEMQQSFERELDWQDDLYVHTCCCERWTIPMIIRREICSQYFVFIICKKCCSIFNI